MTDEFVDPIYLCMYCGSIMEQPNEKMMAIFGHPSCCETKMVVAERDKIFDIVKALDKMKENLEQEILKGML